MEPKDMTTDENTKLQAYLTVLTAYQPQVIPGRSRITFLTKKPACLSSGAGMQRRCAPSRSWSCRIE